MKTPGQVCLEINMVAQRLAGEQRHSCDRRVAAGRQFHLRPDKAVVELILANAVETLYTFSW